MVSRDFGKYLRRKRMARGISQREVANHLGYTSQFVANWERGISSPPAKVIPVIASYLRIPTSEIIQVLTKNSEKFWKNLFSA